MQTKRQSGQPTAATAQVVHLSLLLGILSFLGVIVLGGVGPSAPVELPFLIVVVPVVAFSSWLAAFLFATKLPSRTAGTSADEWWSANFPKAIVIWALIEGPTVLATVALFLGGARFMYIWIGLGLLLLLMHAPTRLADRAG